MTHDLFTPRPDPVSLNEQGRPFGERHPRAELTDRDVDQIRDAYDAGEGGYGALARRFDTSKSNVRSIVKCRTRAHTEAKLRVKRQGCT